MYEKLLTVNVPWSLNFRQIILVVIFVLIGFTNLALSQVIKLTSDKSQDDIFVAMTVTSSGRDCGSFQFAISHNRELQLICVFRGVENQLTKTKLTRRQLSKLKRLIRSINYFEIRTRIIDEKDGCEELVSNYEWTTTEIRIGKKRNRVERYLGCLSGTKSLNLSLRRLNQLEKHLKKLAAFDKKTEIK